MAGTAVAVVGAGSWGTTVAALVAGKGVTTRLWARRAEAAEELSVQHRSPYLPGVSLPWSLRATSDLAEALDGAGVVVMGVPSHALRAVAGEMAPLVPEDSVVVSLAKGIERESLKRMTEVIADCLPGFPAERVGVLSGPNLAIEIAKGQPAASVVALPREDLALAAQEVFMAPTFRVYTNTDVVGCELGGAIKNAVAIAAGMSDGIGYGDNAKAALITRGLAELTRLGMRLGGRPLTFAGLAGMGDLIATCTSLHSRNRHVGEELGRGRKLDEVVASMNMVAEGVKSTRAICDLAARVEVEMPIAEQVAAVLYEGKAPEEVVGSLMGRAAKPEVY